MTFWGWLIIICFIVILIFTAIESVWVFIEMVADKVHKIKERKSKNDKT